MTPLALTLLHSVWEEAALAASASIAWGFCKSGPARYSVGVGSLALMVAAPVATFLLLRAHGGAPPPVFSAYAPALPALPALRDSFALDRALPAHAHLKSDWLVDAWLAGVLLLALRSIGGALAVRRLLRKGTAPVAREFHDLCARVQGSLGIARAVRYLESPHVHAPMAAGWIRPAVIVPIGGLAGLAPAQREGVLAHELAHVRRFDTLVNLGQVVVEALLFYHPAAWWLSGRIRAERENCCDDVAVAYCGDALAYSRALTQMAEEMTAPRLAMAANRSPLVARVARLLAGSRARRPFVLARVLAGALGFVMALAAGVVFVGCLQTGKAPAAEAPVAGSPAPAGARAPSYITSLQEAGLSSFDVDQLLSMKIHGVTGDYVRQMRALGLEPTPDDFVAMKIEGVSPDDVKSLHERGLRPACDEIIQLKIQGALP